MIGLSLAALPAFAGDVLKIRAGQCALQPKERALTGFVATGHAGIITALHGVADCAEITAQSSSRRVALAVRVDRQDATADAALLVPRDAAEEAKLASPLDAFEVLPASATMATDLPVTAIGYPHGVVTVQRNTRLAIGAPPSERLGDILGTKNTDIAERHSPDINLRVVKLEGLVVKGESGAPVIVPSNSDRVVGLVLGSPDPGASNIAWVAPMTAINWVPFDAVAWRTGRLPNALASAVGLPEAGPTSTYRLELSHGVQTVRETKEFQVAFSDETASTAVREQTYEQSFAAEAGATFEAPALVETESMGAGERRLAILNGGQRALISVVLRTGPTMPRAAFRGTVRLVQVRAVAPQSTATTVEIRNAVTREAGNDRDTYIGEARITAETAGQWESFTIRDSSGRVIASGPVGATLGEQMKVGVASAGPSVTVGVIDRPAPPMNLRIIQ